VKLLHLSCTSSACGLRHVPALLVCYSSFGSQNTVQCKSQCIKMPPTVSKLKGKKMFSVALYMLRQTLCRLAPRSPFHLSFPSFSDAAEALRYSASTCTIKTTGIHYSLSTRNKITVFIKLCTTPDIPLNMTFYILTFMQKHALNSEHVQTINTNAVM
jgi:hypothetical protein